MKGKDLPLHKSLIDHNLTTFFPKLVVGPWPLASAIGEHPNPQAEPSGIGSRPLTSVIRECIDPQDENLGASPFLEHEALRTKVLCFFLGCLTSPS